MCPTGRCWSGSRTAYPTVASWCAITASSSRRKTSCRRGAPLLHDFWKGAKAEDKDATKPEAKDQPAKTVEGQVKDVDKDGRIRIDIGKNAGLAKGDVLTVLRIRQETEVPLYLAVGRIRVVEVGDCDAVAEPAEKANLAIRPGDSRASTSRRQVTTIPLASGRRRAGRPPAFAGRPSLPYNGRSRRVAPSPITPRRRVLPPGVIDVRRRSTHQPQGSARAAGLPKRSRKRSVPTSCACCKPAKTSSPASSATKTPCCPRSTSV